MGINHGQEGTFLLSNVGVPQILFQDTWYAYIWCHIQTGLIGSYKMMGKSASYEFTFNKNFAIYVSFRFLDKKKQNTYTTYVSFRFLDKKQNT